jgi:hypothetical protein
MLFWNFDRSCLSKADAFRGPLFGADFNLASLQTQKEQVCNNLLANADRFELIVYHDKSFLIFGRGRIEALESNFEFLCLGLFWRRRFWRCLKMVGKEGGLIRLRLKELI